MDYLKILAPAKLNLFLHIIGRRADGYHYLQTVFQFLDYCDELSFTLRSDAKIHLTTPLANIPDEDNLIMRAAKLLQQVTHTSRGVDMGLQKRIPMGGGLGGGSSNAAATLVALNYLWQLHLSVNQLADLGLSLGADVPVFAQGKAAWAEGIGEKLSSISLPEPWFLVIIPPCQVVTAEIYAAPELTRNTPPITIREFLTGGGHNDCEPLVRQRYPAVDQAINWLSQFAPAQLTGTGACVFASFASKEQALIIAQQMPAGFASFVAKGLNKSPLQAMIAHT